MRRNGDLIFTNQPKDFFRNHFISRKSRNFLDPKFPDIKVHYFLPFPFRHRVTRQTKSVIFRSKDHVQIRRSKRLANDNLGTKRIRVPILVAEPEPHHK